MILRVRIVCYPRESYSRDVSEFLFTGIEMALRRDSPGELKGHVYMATYPRVIDIERTATVDARQVLTDEVRRGLIRSPRSLSPWMFYDAEGSRLFERITTLPEYYPAPCMEERHPRATRGCDRCCGSQRQIVAIAPR